MLLPSQSCVQTQSAQRRRRAILFVLATVYFFALGREVAFLAAAQRAKLTSFTLNGGCRCPYCQVKASVSCRVIRAVGRPF